MHSENLFTNYSQIENNAPLADKLRPKNLEDFFGQQPILNENSLLRNAILNDKISNFIFSVRALAIFFLAVLYVLAIILS